jgi:hypothetical protein
MAIVAQLDTPTATPGSGTAAAMHAELGASRALRARGSALRLAVEIERLHGIPPAKLGGRAAGFDLAVSMR